MTAIALLLTTVASSVTSLLLLLTTIANLLLLLASVATVVTDLLAIASLLRVVASLLATVAGILSSLLWSNVGSLWGNVGSLLGGSVAGLLWGSVTSISALGVGLCLLCGDQSAVVLVPVNFDPVFAKGGDEVAQLYLLVILLDDLADDIVGFEVKRGKQVSMFRLVLASDSTNRFLDALNHQRSIIDQVLQLGIELSLHIVHLTFVFKCKVVQGVGVGGFSGVNTVLVEFLDVTDD